MQMSRKVSLIEREIAVGIALRYGMERKETQKMSRRENRMNQQVHDPCQMIVVDPRPPARREILGGIC